MAWQRRAIPLTAARVALRRLSPSTAAGAHSFLPIGISQLAILCVAFAVGRPEPTIAAEVSAPLIVATWEEAAAGVNLARDAKVTVSAVPHYPPEPGAWEGRLTDGRISPFDQRMWTSSAVVGWKEVEHVVVNLDLRGVHPIRQVAVRVLGGRAQIHLRYPRAITVWLSEDADRWFPAAALESERDLPAERGDAHVANVVFPCHARARYVAIHFELGVDFLFLDEIAVIRDDTTASSPPLRTVEASVQEVPRGVVAFADKHEWVISNPPLPTFLTILRDGSRDAPHDVSASFDVPVNVSVRGGTPLGPVPGRPGIVRYRALISHPHPSMVSVSRPLFLTVSGDLPPQASVRILPLVPDGRAVEIPLRTIQIPAVRAPRELHVSLAWMQANIPPHWPDLLSTLGSLGFNAVGVFPQYWPGGLPPADQDSFLAAARGAGMQLIYVESPFHVMEERHRGEKELYTQKPGGASGPGVSPCYRGPFYHQEVARIEQLARVVRPTWVFFDSELWARGTADADLDEQCAALRAGGATGASLRATIGAQLAADLRRALTNALPDGPRPHAGLYGVEPTHIYQGLFDFSAIFPQSIDLAMPSLYVAGDPLAVHDAIRAIVHAQPRAFALPWLTAGTQGEFPSDRIRSMVLEAFFNGARGITYYRTEDFDTPEDFRAHASAIALVSRYEDFFTDGGFDESLRAGDPDITLSARTLPGKRLILVGSYRSRGAETVELQTRCSGGIRDAETDTPILAPNGVVRFDLPPQTSRVLACKSPEGNAQ